MVLPSIKEPAEVCVHARRPPLFNAPTPTELSTSVVAFPAVASVVLLCKFSLVQCDHESLSSWPRLQTDFSFLWCPEGDLNPHGIAPCGF